MVEIYMDYHDHTQSTLRRDWDSFHKIYIANKYYRRNVNFLCKINRIIFIKPIILE